MGKCAIIGAVCPETSDASRKRYCPHWKVGIPDVIAPTGFTAQPTFTGCFLRKIDAYFIATATDAAHSARAYDKAYNELCLKLPPGPAVKALMSMGLAAFAGELQGSAVSRKNGEELGDTDG